MDEELEAQVEDFIDDGMVDHDLHMHNNIEPLSPVSEATPPPVLLSPQPSSPSAALTANEATHPAALEPLHLSHPSASPSGNGQPAPESNDIPDFSMYQTAPDVKDDEAGGMDMDLVDSVKDNSNFEDLIPTDAATICNDRDLKEATNGENGVPSAENMPIKL
ncbi:hypothetical protein BC829DRAFT_273307 [Chytridium lagenaria]|nr:hypothetical protein BC829DRAFT_273307 [Chytridium lagenaria]